MGTGAPIHHSSLWIFLGLLLCFQAWPSGLISLGAGETGRERFAEATTLERSNERKSKLLFFTARWCAPCKKIQPALVELVEKFPDDLDLVVIDFDESPFAVETFEITEVPTMILLSKEDLEVMRVNGASREGIKALIRGTNEYFRCGE